VWNERDRRNEERELVYEISWIPELNTWRRFCGHRGANKNRSRSRCPEPWGKLSGVRYLLIESVFTIPRRVEFSDTGYRKAVLARSSRGFFANDFGLTNNGPWAKKRRMFRCIDIGNAATELEHANAQRKKTMEVFGATSTTEEVCSV
jgi:hypothetical protein